MGVNGIWTPKLGLDLQGGTTATLTAKNTTDDGAVSADSLEVARGILAQRVDSMGVGETEVTTSGTNQIIVSAPNVQKEELLDMIGKTAQLYFRKVYDVQQSETAITSTGTTEVSTGDAGGERAVPALPTPVPSPRPTSAAEPAVDFETLDKMEPSERDEEEFAAFSCGKADGTAATSPTPDVTDQFLIACDESGSYKYLLGPALIAGQEVTDASAGVPSNDVSWVVTLKLDSEGASKFATVTGELNEAESPKNQFGIVLDGRVISAPSVTEGAITGGSAQISGSFTQKTAQNLANVLKYGSLPLAFDISSVENVSAKLGGEQLTVGLTWGLVGLGLVVLYALFYYHALAALVVASLVIAGTLTYALIVILGEAMGYALNLSGIAGAIVAIGVTADSFIIYFERIRDEVREGRSLRTAIQTGWVGSRKTILAADSVNLLSAVVLYLLAVSSVKGFAFTLGLTTLIDVAIVFWFTHPMMTLLGNTKYFGEGKKFSGFEAAHLGKRSPLAPKNIAVPAAAATEGGE
jgi:preprotein translocase subunit SecD